MKYIRTKATKFSDDEILEVLHESEDHYECEGAFEKRMGCKVYVKKEVAAKVADSLEELCDEFVWVTPEREHHIKPKIGDGLWYLCCDYKKGHQIYGAIWTDKGLIYVAKMNKKGELELL